MKQKLRAARRAAAGRQKSGTQLMMKLTLVGVAMSGLSALFAGGQFLFGDNIVRQVRQRSSEIAEVRKEQPPVSRVYATPQIQVQITSPANNSVFSSGDMPTISATAISRNSSIATIGFYYGTKID